MDRTRQLISLLAELSSLESKEDMIRECTEELSRIFFPVRFYFVHQKAPKATLVFELLVNGKSAGFLVSTDKGEISRADISLISGIVSVVCGLLEREDNKGYVADESDFLETIKQRKMHELSETMNSLKKARTAAINLIEDLSQEIEKRVVAEKTLRDSEQNYRTLFESNRDGIFILAPLDDGSFEVMEVNEATRQILGYTLPEYSFMNPLDFEVGATPELLQKRMAQFQEEGIIEFNATIIHKKGHKINVNIRAIAIEYAGKQAVYNILRDTTSQKKAEQIMNARIHLLEIAETHDLHVLLQKILAEAENITQSKIGFYHFFDEQDQIIHLREWSENTIRHFCTSPDNLDSHYPIDKAGVWIECIAKREPVIHNDYQSLENKKGMPEGHAVLIRQLVVPVMRNKTIVAILGIGNKETDYDENDVQIISQLADLAWDIAERKIAQDQLKQSEEKYRLIFDKTPLGIVHFDVAGNATQYNERFAEIASLDLRPNRTFNFLNLPDKSLVEAIERIIQGKDAIIEGLYEGFSLSGAIPLRLHFSAVINEAGETQGGICLLEDRTPHYEKEEYRRQVEVVKESARFKQNFLANMSHEIRTPLTGVMGMVEILEQSDLAPHQKEYISILKQSGENLSEIINQVLDFSKIEAGKVSLNKSVFPFQALLENTHNLFSAICAKDVLFTVKTDKNIPPIIKGDKNRIAQVINNLISNAVKFTERGSISLKASLVKQHHDSGKVEIKIEVTDTGVGIKQEMIPQLFTPFAQIDQLDTRIFEGTGLGLSISKELVKLHGGEIGVVSNYEKGSTFWFTFLAETAIDESEKLQTSEFKDKQPHSSLHILFAEDKLVNQKVIKLMLSSMGHKVTLAENGQKALDIYKNGKFDLILMDIQMPVMNGIDATRAFKARYTKLPPIVGLSANAFEGDKEKYMEMGMDDYITKPVKKEEFYDLLRRLYSDGLLVR